MISATMQSGVMQGDRKYTKQIPYNAEHRFNNAPGERLPRPARPITAEELDEAKATSVGEINFLAINREFSSK